jgi:hypothetical protein
LRCGYVPSHDVLIVVTALPPPGLLTITQAAALTGVSPATIRQWLHRGHLPSRWGRCADRRGALRQMRLIGEDDLLVAERATRQRGGHRRYLA